ncbi:MAG: CdaR family protein [Thermacetogeniaceae bacterium]|nr:hypothetical protein [Syntrophomonadaceae bacterium]
MKDMKDSKLYKWFNRNNIGYKLLAILVAVMLWYYVAGQRDPIIERNFTIQAVPRGLSSEQVLITPLPEVKVTVRGLQSIVRNVRDSDLRVYVEIGEGVVGEKLLPVKVEAPFGVQVVKCDPEQIKLDLDRMTEKSVPVRILVRGETAAGFTYQDPEAKPDEVTVKGPSRFVDQVQNVQAILELNNASSSISRQVKVQLPDNLHDKVTVEPGSVQVKVNVVTSGPIKYLTVVAQLQGDPAEGYTVKNHRVEPNRLQVTGSAGLLSSISELRTKPVDITGAKGNISREVEVILPEGVIPLAQRTVKVTVVIEPLPAEEEEPPDQNNDEQLPG